jgi:hypothetical protein
VQFRVIRGKKTETTDAMTLNLDLDQQVALLMQGTGYGGEQLEAAMAGELRERLKEGRPPRVLQVGKRKFVRLVAE